MKKNKPPPWSYRKGYSPLHRLGAGYKLAVLLVLSLAAFFPGSEARSLAILSGIALVLIVLSFIAGSCPRNLLRGSGPLFFVMAAVFLVQGIEISPPGFNLEGLLESVIFCFRIAAAFAAGALFFAVTTTGEIRKSLAGGEPRSLQTSAKVPRLRDALYLGRLRLSLSISLMLGFIPRFFEIWEDTNLAWKSRGGGKNLSRLVVLIPLVLERMMIKAAETASALESRASI